MSKPLTTIRRWSLLAVVLCPLPIANVWGQTPAQEWIAPDDSFSARRPRTANSQPVVRSQPIVNHQPPANSQPPTQSVLQERLPAPDVEPRPIVPVHGGYEPNPPVFQSGIDSNLKPLPADVAERAWEAFQTDMDRPFQNFPSLGTDRVPFALFEIDPARPQTAIRFRYDAGYHVNRPNRSEFFGPKELVGNYDFQDLSFYHETSTGRASGFLEVPLRTLDPLDPPGVATRRETTGLSNLQFGAKSILLDGPDFFMIPTTNNPSDAFYVSMVFRTYVSLTPKLEQRGLTTGHTSLEPGLLANYQYSPNTNLHGEFKYWIPIAGDKDFQGEVMKYGIGISHVAYSGPLDFAACENVALIPTLELYGWEFISGRETAPNGIVKSIDSVSVVNVQAGLRVVLGHRFEMGSAAAFNPTSSRLYENLLRFEARWFW